MGIIRGEMPGKVTRDGKRGELPFAVARSSRATLVEQVVEGLRRAIDSGFYKTGDILPTTRDLAEMLGVSRIVTRAAVRELTKAELINPRPSVGCVVLGSGGKLWKGNVLFVSRSNGRVYYDNVFTTTLRANLVRNGWLVTTITSMGRAGGKVDTSELEMHLKHPVTLAVVLFDNPVAERVLSRSGVPFVTLGNKRTCRIKGCVGHVSYDRSAAVAEFAESAKRAGVKRALEVGWENFDDVGGALKAVGVSTTKWNVPVQPGGDLPVAVSFAVRDAFLERLKPQKMRDARNLRSVPDLIYFSDDYACTGALAAFAAAGVRITEDVRVVTWSNKGNDPVFAKELTRMEMDPEGDAEKVAAGVLAWLEGRPGDFPLTLGPVFRRGATL